MSAIDIGPDATSRTAGAGAGSTFIMKANPANDSGVITSVDVWAYATITGLRVGTFYLVSGTTYKCRDSASLGSVATGSKQTFTGLAITVVAGDLIGFYITTSGSLMYSTSGGTGYFWVSGEYIDPTDSTSYTSQSSRDMSLYGAGATPSLTGAAFLLRMI